MNTQIRLIASRLLLGGSLIAGSGTTAALTYSQDASAAACCTAASLAQLQLLGVGDYFYNYDFKYDSTVANTTVDWPVNFLFTGNATKTKAKNSTCFNYTGSLQYMRVFTNGVLQTDSNGGTKSTNGGNNISLHMRLYGQPNTLSPGYAHQGSLGNGAVSHPTYGYFVVGTSHKDYYEGVGGPNQQYGDSEDAETQIRAVIGVCKGYLTSANNISMGNYQYSTQTDLDGYPHVWANNGLATRVYVP
jgi:hypothetical protein